MLNSFYNIPIVIKLTEHWTLLSEIQEIFENINNSSCRGSGKCGKCKVKIISGLSTPVTPEEMQWLSAKELAEGIRLACFCKMKGDIEIRLPEKQTQQILHHSTLTGENFSHQKSDSERCGLAVDIGTTSIAGLLFDLDSGIKLSAVSCLNPQSAIGTDLLTRISYSSKPGGTEHLHTLILECIDQLAVNACNLSGIEIDNIKNIAITGNTVMLHLLAGVTPSGMGYFPYNPVFTGSFSIKAVNLGLKKVYNAELFFAPSSSAFIGSDITAGLITIPRASTEKILLIDMGTNGEMVLCADSKLWGCSVAMGPALEGMNIECGMRAENGAIDKVFIKNEEIQYTTISDYPAAGICGSGLIDLVYSLIRQGIINKTGKFIKYNSNDGSKKFIIPLRYDVKKEIYISQSDIRSLQLAKGAVAAGITILLKTAGVKPDEIDRVYISGAIGYYTNHEALIAIGFLPRQWENRIISAGNTSLAGAASMLFSDKARTSASDIAQKIFTIDLTAHNDFQTLFINSMSFVET